MIKINEVIEALKPKSSMVNFPNQLIESVIKSDVNNRLENVIFWVSIKFKDTLKDYTNGCILCSELPIQMSKNCNYLVFENPREAFQKLLAHFFTPPVSFTIAKSAIVPEVIKSSQKVSIGENVVIEENVSVGENVIIGHNTVICNGTKIGNNVVIGHNNTIGGVGFGYEKDETGAFQLIQHIGGVIIGNDVEIGNNTCIDRAVLGNTIIGKGTKIDNLVHIAHNIEIGENCAIIANAMIGGSTKIADGVWVAPSATLRDGLSISKNSIIGLGAVLTKSIGENEIWAGNPAKKFEPKQ
jgi:UDP-3-O-[3-hydroxymyristoyl] glucosamine N-acyltransferase